MSPLGRWEGQMDGIAYAILASITTVYTMVTAFKDKESFRQSGIGITGHCRHLLPFPEQLQERG
jgi:hypothetical protein